MDLRLRTTLSRHGWASLVLFLLVAPSVARASLDLTPCVCVLPAMGGGCATAFTPPRAGLHLELVGASVDGGLRHGFAVGAGLGRLFGVRGELLFHSDDVLTDALQGGSVTVSAALAHPNDTERGAWRVALDVVAGGAWHERMRTPGLTLGTQARVQWRRAFHLHLSSSVAIGPRADERWVTPVFTVGFGVGPGAVSERIWGDSTDAAPVIRPE